jgi:hypothetical protein
MYDDTSHVADAGMSRHVDRDAWMRCAAEMTSPDARCYELGRPLTSTGPQSPFALPVEAARFTRTMGKGSPAD